MPSPKSFPQGWVVSAAAQRIAASSHRLRVRPPRRARAAPTWTCRGSRCSRWPAGPPRRLVVAGEAVVQDRGRPVRQVAAIPCPSAAAGSIAPAITAEASASLPCRARSLSKAYGRDTAPGRLRDAVDLRDDRGGTRKSPVHELTMPSWRGGSATARARRRRGRAGPVSRRCVQASESHTMVVANGASSPTAGRLRRGCW